MKQNDRAAALMLALALILALGSGCSLIEFKSRAEYEKQQQYSAELSQMSGYVDPHSVLSDDLVFTAQLVTESGVLAASYSARCPGFLAEGGKSVVFERINEYYQTEFALFEEDCASFFELVKKGYGAEWPEPQEILAVQTAAFGYTLLGAPASYIGVLRDYTGVNALGEQTRYYYGDLFLASTGWQLKFDDLFSNALDTLKREIESWCTAQGVAFDRLEGAALSDLTGQFTLDEQTLYIGLCPFVLSNEQRGGLLLELPLSAFADFMTGK